MLSKFENENIGLYRVSCANSATSLLENEPQSLNDSIYLSLFNSADEDDDGDYDEDDDGDQDDEDDDSDFDDDEDDDSDFNDDEGEEDDE